MKEIIPFGSPIFVILGDRTKVLSVKSDFNSLAFDLAELILLIFLFIFFFNNFEPVAVIVVFIFEEMLKDDVLVFLQNTIFAFYESREKTQILSSQLRTILV